MQYDKCYKCKNATNMCQMLLAPGIGMVNNLETTLNRALSYSRQKNKNIQIKIDFTCLGFEPREETYNVEQTTR